jgi:hypothetical protein
MASRASDGATRHRARQRLGRQPLARTHGLGHALEELREDRAGIAARAIDRLRRRAPQHFAGTRQLRRAHALQHRAQREREIGAGVAIRHRKHVDAVDLVASGDDALDAGRQCPTQTVARQALHADLCSHALLSLFDSKAECRQRAPDRACCDAASKNATFCLPRESHALVTC